MSTALWSTAYPSKYYSSVALIIFCRVSLEMMERVVLVWTRVDRVWVSDVQVCVYPALLAYHRDLVLCSTLRPRIHMRHYTLIPFRRVLVFTAVLGRIELGAVSHRGTEVGEVVAVRG